MSSRVPIIREEDLSEKIEVLQPSKTSQPTEIQEPPITTPPSIFSPVIQISEKNKNDVITMLDSFNGFVGFELRDLNSNQILIEYNSQKLFVPASLSKLFTALVALESLGNNYRFETHVYITGDITPNFMGNIYIKGFGDPVLTSVQYKEILKKITIEKGINKIYGDIIFDYSFLKEEGFGRGWMWDDPQPQIASLNIWQTNYESFKYKTDLEIKDYITYLTTIYLQELGITFYGEIKYEKVPVNSNLIYTHYSPPLIDITKQMLETSDNQIAEQLFRNLGSIYGEGTIDSSENHYKNVIEKTLGYQSDKYIIKDGCGLSMYNLTSPKMVNDTIFYLYKKYDDKFLDLLASPYEESTIKNRFSFEIWAKTGTLYYDSAISGILKTKKGNSYLFTLMENNFAFNNRRAKEFENSIIQYIYENL
ncbi:D-alanyl-D-alanine carboxypeptidase/D-alanyl-D-alanine-endopeptidase [Petrotoga sp. 9PWA.NaAc.5.4]|uniref:D-alanyl-D-alanine carboxypeptidase/D-alanyl-D-alanine-endopeptidase n=1 Tax=Petrotoga sp. 9PWA.NaAc.5.4 TaxID=1434328 RepID=UPI000CBF623C|nr:D-alanyl-D-alanine carboxypeptidase [Petrotoga sp. 9PWA.NaAc.5.4]PNR92860.1 hypothetical protein X924_08760 [Petrotoga sp. 9PWA.NaAc.5.4]